MSSRGVCHPKDQLTSRQFSLERTACWGVLSFAPLPHLCRARGDHANWRDGVILEIFFARGSEGEEWQTPLAGQPDMDESPKTPLEVASDASEDASQAGSDVQGLVVEEGQSRLAPCAFPFFLHLLRKGARGSTSPQSWPPRVPSPLKTRGKGQHSSPTKLQIRGALNSPRRLREFPGLFGRGGRRGGRGGAERPAEKPLPGPAADRILAAPRHGVGRPDPGPSKQSKRGSEQGSLKDLHSATN